LTFNTNADANMHLLWGVIGDTYPGNPYKVVRGPSQSPVLSHDDVQVAAASGDEVVATGYLARLS
jgi:hypothetical protein